MRYYEFATGLKQLAEGSVFAVLPYGHVTDWNYQSPNFQGKKLQIRSNPTGQQVAGVLNKSSGWYKHVRCSLELTTDNLFLWDGDGGDHGYGMIGIASKRALKTIIARSKSEWLTSPEYQNAAKKFNDMHQEMKDAFGDSENLTMPSEEQWLKSQRERFMERIGEETTNQWVDDNIHNFLVGGFRTSDEDDSVATQHIWSDSEHDHRSYDELKAILVRSRSIANATGNSLCIDQSLGGDGSNIYT